jgi:hypothetical protein
LDMTSSIHVFWTKVFELLLPLAHSYSPQMTLEAQTEDLWKGIPKYWLLHSSLAFRD